MKIPCQFYLCLQRSIRYLFLLLQLYSYCFKHSNITEYVKCFLQYYRSILVLFSSAKKWIEWRKFCHFTFEISQFCYLHWLWNMSWCLVSVNYCIIFSGMVYQILNPIPASLLSHSSTLLWLSFYLDLLNFS